MLHHNCFFLGVFLFGLMIFWDFINVIFCYCLCVVFKINSTTKRIDDRDTKCYFYVDSNNNWLSLIFILFIVFIYLFFFFDSKYLMCLFSFFKIRGTNTYTNNQSNMDAHRYANRSTYRYLFILNFLFLFVFYSCDIL